MKHATEAAAAAGGGTGSGVGAAHAPQPPGGGGDDVGVRIDLNPGQDPLTDSGSSGGTSDASPPSPSATEKKAAAAAAAGTAAGGTAAAAATDLPSTARRRRVLRHVAIAAGLLLFGLGVGLAIGLPAGITRGRAGERGGPRGARPLDLASSGGGAAAGEPLSGATRRYFLAAEPVDWDYAPGGRNLCWDKPLGGEHDALYTTEGLGTRYTKAVYRAYTDATFATPVPRGADEQHLGLLGPTLRAEVGDVLEVTLLNRLPFAVNAQPGGVRAADGGGAPAAANPGERLVSSWYVPPSAGPNDGGASTQPWVYRSGVDVVRDTQAGLAGFLVVGRPGSLGDGGNGLAGRPKDVDAEHFLMLQVFDESFSPFYDDNVARAGAKGAAALEALGEEDAAEAQKKYSVNGYVYCNLPGLNSTAGQRVRWYVSALGSEDAIHTAHWHGIVLSHNGRNLDQVPVLASSLYALDTVNDNPGRWLFHCHLTDHMHGGMMALFNIEGDAPKAELRGGKTREYFIAAVEELWDYAPLGGEFCGAKLLNFSDAAKTFVEPGPNRIGRKYLKARYVEFTDATFTTRKRRAPEWEHLGVLGPAIRGSVGDTLKVTFKNLLKGPAGGEVDDDTDEDAGGTAGVRRPRGRSVSMHPHGVLYDKGSEGSPYNDGVAPAPGDAVAPGKVVTYTWLVPERAGPGPNGLGSTVWLYHSHVNEAADPYAGLLGPIIITAAGNANDDGSPKDVDREFVLAFAILDETASLLFPDNAARFLKARGPAALEALEEDPGFGESNLMHSVNGYLYCNLPGVELVQGSPARVHFLAIGSSADMHTPNSPEAPLFVDGQRRQAIGLLPGGMLSVDTIPAVAGKGLLQCHIADHIAAGMAALFDVKNLGQLAAPPANAPVREHFIAAEVVPWDYAPLGFDGCSGQPLTEEQALFVRTSPGGLGSRYLKALFVEYTDGSFKTRKPQPPEHGFLGPMLRAEVGDKLVVHFLNRLPFEASVQAFGGLVPVGNTTLWQVNAGGAGEAEAAKPGAGRRLLLQQQQRRGPSHGRGLRAGITAAAAEAEAAIAESVENLYALGGVKPNGGAARYEWVVPDGSGPASRDGASVAYAYVSGVDHVKHISAGLVGPLIIYKRGRLADPGVDRELPLFLGVHNEMQSPLFERNLAAAQKAFAAGGGKVDTTSLTFPESNLMHAINGHVYCNGATVQLRRGETVRWHVMAFGSETDMHAPVFDGQAAAVAGAPTYSVGLMPATTFGVDMAANATGAWSVYCNVLDHIKAGMRARMLVS